MRRPLIALAVAALVGASVPIVTESFAQAVASHNVAYVFDFGTGINDRAGPGSGSSIFVDAITGSPIGTGTTGVYNGANFTDLPVTSIDAAPPTALNGFDTAILFQVCDISSHPRTLSALNTFVENGGKLMIFDSDRCAEEDDGGEGVADYSGFLFPFTTSAPGPQGAAGEYSKVESSTLTTGLAPHVPIPGDAVGDANTFTSNAGGWCTSIQATNAKGNTGNVEAYARTANGGLAIYEGEDFWFTFGPEAHLKQVFDLMLAQAFNPDDLPCSNPASGIKLAPLTATNSVGGSQVETATVVGADGRPQAGTTVTFTVLSGPDAGATGHAVTDGSGQARFTITNATGPGTDVVQARFDDSIAHLSNTTAITWTARATRLTYTGATTGDFNDPAILAATLDDGELPIADQQVTFRLGGAQTCAATTDGVGIARCTIVPNESAGTVPIEVVFAGSPGLLPSSASATFAVTQEETTLTYTGDVQVTNGTPAQLSGVLAEDGTTPITGRSVTFTIGSTSSTAQSCTGTTAANGAASCIVTSVNQPQNPSLTVELNAAFAGDGFYRPAAAAATLKLTNFPPTVSAGGPYSGNEDNDVAIAGKAADPDGPALTTQWSIEPRTGVPPGSKCTFGNAGVLSTTVNCTERGTYTLTLTANDSTNPPTSNSTTLTLFNVPPKVSAGGPYSGNEDNNVAIAGTATDPDGPTLTTTWSIQPAEGVPPGATCLFGDAGALSTTVNCTERGTYTLTLTANDGVNPPVSSNTTLTLLNVPPRVSAGGPYSGEQNHPVKLAGTVADPDGPRLTTMWTVAPNRGVDPAAFCSFTDPTKVSTVVTCSEPGTYTLTLTADDHVNAPVVARATVTMSQTLGSLALITTVDPVTGFVGGNPVVVTEVVHNIGPAIMKNVRLSTTLPPAPQPFAVSPANCARSCDLGTLSPGQSVSVRISFPTNAPADQLVAATVTTTGPDVDKADNGGSVRVVIRQPVLTTDPGAGPQGFVPHVSGTDFPPGAHVRLQWSIGLSETPGEWVVGPDGRLDAWALVFPKDIRGSRALQASSASGTPFGQVTSNPFLVLSRSLQPLDFVIR